MKKINYLSQFDLMESLSDEDMAEMDRMTVITPYSKHAYIQMPDTFVPGLYFIKKGKVRLFQVSPEGKAYTADILHESNVFGELGAISFGTRHLFVQAMEDSDICFMNQSRLDGFLVSNPRFMMNLLEMLGERMKRMSEWNQNLALGNLHAKTLHVLADLARRFGVTDDGEYRKIAIPLSHQELAGMVGASREAVSVALQELSKEGAVKTGFRSVSIHREKL